MQQNPFRYFKTSPEIIQLAVMMYVRFPLSLAAGLSNRNATLPFSNGVSFWLDRAGDAGRCWETGSH